MNILKCVRKKDYLGLIGMATISYWGVFSIALLSLIFTIIYRPFLEKDTKVPFSIEDLGQFGDSVGGMSGPIIAIVGVTLTYLAFIAQVKANKIIHEESVTTNRADICLRLLDRFEGKLRLLFSAYSNSFESNSLSEILEKYAKIHSERLEMEADKLNPYDLAQYAVDSSKEHHLISSLASILNHLNQVINLTGEMREGPERKAIYLELEKIAQGFSTAELMWAEALTKLKKIGNISDNRITEIHVLLQSILKSFKIFPYGTLLLDRK
ncbi:MAG: hypothetical protein IPO40_23720 [Fibrobacteres bacterium]|nr:hypothetical protein [Fibrobacterota bacterium]